MRRKEKEIQDREAIDAIIRECKVCRLGMTDGMQPYVVPLSFGYDGEAIYFHGASSGKKIDLLKANNRVCVEFDILDGVRPAETACKWSATYRSVIGFGAAELIDDPAEKERMLAIIMAQYADGTHSFLEEAMKRTTLIRVRLEEVTGKQS